MRRILLILLIITSPIIGQEKKRELYIETAVFTRLEVAGNIMSDDAPIMLLSVTGLEFMIGEKKAYLYTQLRFSTALPAWNNVLDLGVLEIANPKNIFYGRRIGFLVGVGGRIYDSNKNIDYNKWTMDINAGLGGEFSIDKIYAYTPSYDYSSNQYNGIYAFTPYMMIDLSWNIKYHMHKYFGIQFGFNFNTTATDPFYLHTTLGASTSGEVLYRGGFSLGMMF